jgi:hypothetical protein
MKRLLIALLILTLLAACAPAVTQSPDAPVDSNTPQNSEPPVGLTPRPGRSPQKPTIPSPAPVTADW